MELLTNLHWYLSSTTICQTILLIVNKHKHTLPKTGLPEQNKNTPEIVCQQYARPNGSRTTYCALRHQLARIRQTATVTALPKIFKKSRRVQHSHREQSPLSTDTAESQSQTPRHNEEAEEKHNKTTFDVFAERESEGRRRECTVV